MTNEELTLIQEKVNDAFETKKKVKFQYNGEDITIMVSSDNVHVWCDNGGTSIYTNEFDNSTNLSFVKYEVKTAIKDLFSGTILCSDCGRPMDRNEVRGYKRHYFAGVYCQDCWDSKWKERNL